MLQIIPFVTLKAVRRITFAFVTLCAIFSSGKIVGFVNDARNVTAVLSKRDYHVLAKGKPEWDNFFASGFIFASKHGLPSRDAVEECEILAFYGDDAAGFPEVFYVILCKNDQLAYFIHITVH